MRDEGSEPRRSTKPTAREVAQDSRLTWTVPEVARLLGISKDSAYEAAHRGELPVRLIGRRLLVPRVALLRLLNGAYGPEQPE